MLSLQDVSEGSLYVMIECGVKMSVIFEREYIGKEGSVIRFILYEMSKTSTAAYHSSERNNDQGHFTHDTPDGTPLDNLVLNLISQNFSLKIATNNEFGLTGTTRVCWFFLKRNMIQRYVAPRLVQ